MVDKISVIVPVNKDSPEFRKCLASLFSLEDDNYTVILVDDSKNSFLNESFFPQNRKVKILFSSGRGPSYARNIAAKAADSEFLAFTDSDCVVNKDWLAELRRGFLSYSEAVSCGGRQDIPLDASPFEKKVFRFMKKAGLVTDYVRKADKEEIMPVKHNPSCNAMYKKDIFIKEGGFLEGLWPGEDVEFDYRLIKKGYKLVFNPKAAVFHYKPKDMRSFLKMMYRYGAAQGFLVRKYGIFRKVQAIPFFTLAGFILFILAISLKNGLLTAFIFILPIAIFLIYFNFNLSLLNLATGGFLFWNLGFLKGFY